MDLKDADKAAKILKKVCDDDCRAHGARSSGDIIDTSSIEYFELTALIGGYTVLREHQKRVRKMLKAIRVAGDDIKWYDLDEI